MLSIFRSKHLLILAFLLCGLMASPALAQTTGAATLVGQAITLNGERFVVVGILPRDFSFLGMDSQLFVPMAFAPGDNMNSHSNYFLRMIGRLKDRIELEILEAVRQEIEKRSASG